MSFLAFDRRSPLSAEPRLSRRVRSSFALLLIVALGLAMGVIAEPLGSLSSRAAAQETATEPAIEADESATEERPTEVERPFLWKFRSPAGTDQYLLGTIHVPDDRVLKLHERIDAALDRADSIFVEVAPADQPRQLAAITMADGRKGADLLGKELAARVDRQLGALRPGLSTASLPAFKIWAWPLILPNLEAQLSDEEQSVMDMMLVERAEKAKKRVASLEDPLGQLAGFDRLTKEEQLQFLEVALDGMEEDDADDEDELGELVDVYLRGDGDRMDAVFREEFFDDSLPRPLAEKIFAALMTDRNQAMADTIDQVVREQGNRVHLFAAGAGHYVVGPTVIELLEKKGYVIERIE